MIQHYFTGLLLTLMVLQNAPASAQTVSLQKKWETPAVLKEPESVLWDQNRKVFYVSNINNPAAGKDNNGSIGRIRPNGEVMDVEWVIGGMDAPKGLGLYKDLLYVADLTKVVVIDTRTGKVVQTIDVADPGMLNDVTVDADGTVYISDSIKKRVYRIRNNQLEIWLESDTFKKPNGLLAHKGKFYMMDMDAGIFYAVDKKSKALQQIAEGLTGGDGIIPYGNDFIISNWNGEIHHVTAKGKVTMLLDTKAEKINAADMAYLPDQRLLLVPTFFANTVVAYQVTSR
jgi:hypothetical protein